MTRKRDIAGSKQGACEPLFATADSREPDASKPGWAARGKRSAAAKSAIAAYALSFAVPFFVVLAAFWTNSIYPFGDTSVMMYDMPVQYAQFFGWLSNVLAGDGNLWYSANAGLGGGTLAQFTYYLSSPLNLLAAFWAPEDMPYFFSVLYLIKIPLCSVAALVYLRGRFGGGIARGGVRAQALSVVFACAYGLTSYVTGYASNIMWLDGVIMLPIVCLGAHRLVAGRGCALLFASAALSILFNWYTGYIVCFFSVFYFAYELVRLRDEVRGRRARTALRYAATMLLAVGASVVLLLPTLLALLGGKGSGAGLASLAGSGTIAINPINLASFFTIGTTPGITVAKATPALVISAAALVGCCAFFCDAARPRTDRAAGAGIVGICALAFVLVPLNTAWLGFVPESSYTGRMGFTLLFGIAALAFEGTLHADARSVVKGGALAFLVVGFAIFNVWYQTLQLRPNVTCDVLELALIIGFTALLALSARPTRVPGGGIAGAGTSARRRAVRIPRTLQTAGVCLLVVLFAGEQVFSARAEFAVCNMSASVYHDSVSELEDFYADAPTDNGFVRTGQIAPYTGSTKAGGSDCTSLLLDSGSFDIYSSTQESDIQTLLQHLGYSKVTPFGTCYASPNTAADALLSVTSIVSETQPPRTVESNDGRTLRGTYRKWDTTSSLPLAYGIADGVAAQNIDWTCDPFENQKLLYSALTGANADGLYHAAAVEETQASADNQRVFTVTAQSDGPVYLYCPSIYLPDVAENGILCYLSVNGQEVQRVGGRGSCDMVYIGEFQAGDRVSVSLTASPADQIAIDKHGQAHTVKSAFLDAPAQDVLVAQTLDLDEMDSLLSRLDTAGSSISSFSDGSASISFTAAQSETVLVSIPYERGWSATVNGRPVEIEELAGGILGIEVDSGENAIELRYTPYGLYPSLAVSLTSLAAFCAWRAIAKRRNRTASEQTANSNDEKEQR